MGESFLENELPYLCAEFEEVRIYPMFFDEGLRKIPSKCRVIELFEDPYKPATLADLIANAFLFSKVLKVEDRRISSDRQFHKRAEVRSSLRQNLRRAQVLKKKIGVFGTHDVFYSYWTSDWATVLSFLVKMKVLNGFVSRVHGFDLYEERHDAGIPFRALHLECAQTIVAVSKDGLKYLMQRYPQYKEKFHLSQLGVKDNGTGNWSKNPVPHIVSCSNVIPLKRVGLIAEALRTWNGPVKWIHFGGGKGLEELGKVVSDLPAHIEVELKGPMPNSAILEYYRHQAVDLFIHLSSTEGGVSVAIQEAASFGIPLIATAVGGVPEICNAHTGLLLSPDPSSQEVAMALDDFFDQELNGPQFREGVRTFWKQNFDAATVFPLFCRLLRS